MSSNEKKRTALIGQSAVGYCAGKPTEKSRVFSIIIKKQWNTSLDVLSTISKPKASVSSGYPNTKKQVKARGRRPSAFIVSRCLDTPMKHEARVLEITSHDYS